LVIIITGGINMTSGVYKRTPKHNAANSKAKTGVPLSPEHCAAMSIASRNSEAVKAHNESMRGVLKSPEHCAAMRVSKSPRTPPHCAAIRDVHTGVKLSPEHCDAMSDGMKNSDAHKTASEDMRGGLDLVTHHYIYDHADLPLNTVKMTRSDHMSLHIYSENSVT
jgi:hypothetical protein